LYQIAEKQRKHVEEQRTRYMDVECTFEPKTNRRKSIGSSQEKTGQERLNALYEHGKKIYEKREELKKEKDAELTFIPKTNTIHSDNASVVSRASSTASHLYPSKEMMQRKREAMEKIKAEKELEGCTFSPSTINRENKFVKQSKGKPTFERLYDEARLARERKRDLVEQEHQKQKQEQLERQREKNQVNKNLGNNEEGVFTRLIKDSKAWSESRDEIERQARARRIRHEWETNKSECTFHPQISPSAKEKSHQSYSDRDDPFDRLYHDAGYRIDKRDIESIERFGLDMQCTFHPKINRKSLEIVQKKRLSREKTQTSPKSSDEDLNQSSIISNDSNINSYEAEIQKLSEDLAKQDMDDNSSNDLAEKMRMERLARIMADDTI